MKTFYSLIFTFLVFNLCCIGQSPVFFEEVEQTINEKNYSPIVDDSKLWSVHLSSGPLEYSLYYKIDDTITFNGIMYRKVYETNDSLQLAWTLRGFVRESDNSEVYYRNTNGDEGLIYKFDLEVNDTVVVYNPFVCPEFNSLIVSETDSVWMGNMFRKRIYFSNSNNEDYWTEGIGSKFGLPFSNCCYVGVLYNLLCYYESDVLIFQNPDFIDCYYPIIDRVGSMENSASFEINYNKIEENIQIRHAHSVLNYDPLTIEIFDLSGNRIYSGLLHPDIQRISTVYFAKGLYLVHIIQKGKPIYKNKIIIY